MNVLTGFRPTDFHYITILNVRANLDIICYFIACSPNIGQKRPKIHQNEAEIMPYFIHQEKVKKIRDEATILLKYRRTKTNAPPCIPYVRIRLNDACKQIYQPTEERGTEGLL